MNRAAHNPAVKLAPWQALRPAWLAALHCLVLLVLATPRLSLSQASPEEYTVKAAFLFHFAQLVDWPEGALDAAAPSLNLCIFEDEPHRQEFQRTIEGKLVGSRVLHLHLLAQAQDINGCNLLFLSRRELRRQSAILDSLRGQPVLTVGETDSFLSDGGMIRFRLDRDKVRFDINLAAADSAHLKISSRLLLLASVAGPGNGADRAR